MNFNDSGQQNGSAVIVRLKGDRGMDPSLTAKSTTKKSAGSSGYGFCITKKVYPYHRLYFRYVSASCSSRSMMPTAAGSFP